MFEDELVRAHGRDHPLFGYWMDSVHLAVAHQRSLIETAAELSGARVHGGDVLDLGCGTGAACLAFAQLGARSVRGVDLRVGGLGLKMAQTRVHEAGVDAQLLAADASRLPLRDGSVDFCFCDQVLEHVPDSAAVIAEIWRVLRPGGAAYIGAPNRLAPIEAHTGLWFAHWLPHRWCERYVKWRGRCAAADVWDVRTRTYWTLTRQLRACGFTVAGSLRDFLPHWQGRWRGPKRLLAQLYTGMAVTLRLPLDAAAPIIALAVIKKGP